MEKQDLLEDSLDRSTDTAEVEEDTVVRVLMERFKVLKSPQKQAFIR